MKKIIFTTLTLIILLTGCSAPENDNSQDISSIPAVEESSQSSVQPSEQPLSEAYLKSDPLPEAWHGEWKCVYSEANYFSENEIIFIKDFDNAVLYTDIVGENTYEENRWFFYDEDAGRIDIYNEPPPFPEDGWVRDAFELKKESETELVFTRVDVGQEVRFERH